MATVEKKIWPVNFELIVSGKKRYELRLNDFDINEGDRLLLKEWDPKTRQYTGRALQKNVTMVRRFTVNDLTKYYPKEEIMEKGLQIISIE